MNLQPFWDILGASANHGASCQLCAFKTTISASCTGSNHLERRTSRTGFWASFTLFIPLLVTSAASVNYKFVQQVGWVNFPTSGDSPFEEFFVQQLQVLLLAYTDFSLLGMSSTCDQRSIIFHITLRTKLSSSQVSFCTLRSLQMSTQKPLHKTTQKPHMSVLHA